MRFEGYSKKIIAKDKIKQWENKRERKTPVMKP
jgi:hypothetical protein